MTRREALFHHLSNLLVGGTGLVYAWMLYAVTPSDEFSVWNHPWQGNVHDGHLVLAPLLILSFGMLWLSHAKPRLDGKKKLRRISGVALCLSFLPMLCSAYFLQISVEESWRNVWKWVHLASSLLWLAAYLTHQLRPRTKPK